MRKLISGFASIVIALGIVGFPALGVPASALSPGLSFSAVDQPTWQTNGVVWAVGQANGLVVAGGTFTELAPPVGAPGTPKAVSALAILDAETGNPSSCQLSVGYAGGTPTVRAITTSPDGNTVYIAGSFASVGGVSASRFAAIDPVACKVLPLRISGISATVRAISVTNTTVYIGGDFMTVGGQSRNRFAAVSAATGALLPWVANADLPGRAIAVSPDGSKVAIGGDFNTVNGENSHSIAVVDGTNGNVVQGYPLGFINQTSVTKTIVSSGNAFYVGNEGTGGGVFDGRLSIDWTTLQQRWRDTCLGATQALAVYEGALYSASHAHDCGSMKAFPDGKRNYFMAQGIDTPDLVAWNPVGNDGINEGIGPRALTVATGNTTKTDYLWAGGEFNRINGKAQMGLTRFAQTPSSVPPAATITAEALTAGKIQLRIRTVVDADDSDLTYNVYRNGAATPIWSGKAKSMWWTRPQITIDDTDVVPGTSYSYRVTVSDGTTTRPLSAASVATASATGSTYATAVLADNPGLYWRYEDSSSGVTQDKSGPTLTGLNGIYKFGATPGEAGPISEDPGSNAVALTGTDGYLYNDQLKPGPATFSIETWFKTTSTTGGELVGFGSGRPRTDDGNTALSGNYDRNIYMDNAGHILSGTYVGRTSVLSTPNTYNDGNWHHVVTTQGAAGTVLYVDGVRIARNSESGNQSYLGVWHIGGDNLNSWPSKPTSIYFKGLLAETAIYDHALPIQSVSKHYVASGRTASTKPVPTDAQGASVFNADPEFYWRFNESSGQTATDSSIMGQILGTLGNSVDRNSAGGVLNGPSITTNGSGNSTVATNAQVQSSPGKYSIQGWFKTTTNRGGKILGFENTQTGSGSSYDKQVYMTDNGSLIFGVYAEGFQTIRSTASYNDGKWHQVVATQGPGGMTLSVDGVAVGSNPTTFNQSYAGYWRVGGGNLGGWPSKPASNNFAGSLDEVAVYYTPLTTEQVQQQYNVSVPDLSAPSKPGDVTATAAAQGIEVAWVASNDNVAVTGYDVFRGTTAGFAVGPDSKVGNTDTASFTDPVSTPGTYYYKVQALDAAGNQSAEAGPANVVVADTTAPTIPADVTASAPAGTVELDWHASTDNVAVTGYDVFRGTSNGFIADASSKVAHVASPGYGDSDLETGTYYYKVAATDAAGNASAPSAAVDVSVLDAKTPSDPANVAAAVEGTSVTLTWDSSVIGNGDNPSYRVYRGTSAGFTADASSKIADVTTAKYVDSDLAVGTYHYKVVAVAPGGQTSGQSAAESAEILDVLAPTVPVNVAGTAGSGNVTLTWTLSTDNVGVSGYAVYRGTSAGFDIGDSSKVGSSVTSSYSDTLSEPGTYYYKVAAFDAAENTSSASHPATVTIKQPGKTVNVNTKDDAMVAQGASGTNYGAATYLSSRSGPSAALVSYLRYDIPDAPAGMVLTGASLQVRTTADAGSGSNDKVTLSVVTAPWVENLLTWTNRPAATGAPAFGTLEDAAAINTTYKFALDTSVVAGLQGTTTSFLMQNANSGTDNLRIWSKESTSASYRPVLILDYSAE